MTNIKMLKSKMALAGFFHFTSDLMNIIQCSKGSASHKINGKADFTQKEIVMLTTTLNLNGDEVKKIFVNEV